MSRKPAFSLAYTHDAAFASQMAHVFTAPSDIPDPMRAILDRLDAATRKERPLAERLEAIRLLTEAEAGAGRAGPPSRS